MGVDFGNLGEGAELTAVKQKPAMRGVPHYEVQKRALLKKTASEPVMKVSRNAFGYSGKAYHQMRPVTASRIPISVRERSEGSGSLSPADSLASLPVTLRERRSDRMSLKRQPALDCLEVTSQSLSSDSGCSVTRRSLDDLSPQSVTSQEPLRRVKTAEPLSDVHS